MKYSIHIKIGAIKATGSNQLHTEGGELEITGEATVDEVQALMDGYAKAIATMIKELK